jgi:adenylate kinase family enzyme
MSLFDMYFFSVLEDDKSMLLDGYPRSIPQLNAYLTKTHEYDRNLLGIFFDLSEQVAIERMMSRARAGETRAVIATRLEKYYKYTHPIMQAFAAQQQLITIDASGTIEQVHHLVKDVLSSYNH